MKYNILGHFAGLKWFFRVLTTYDFDIVIWKWFQHALIVCRNTFIYGFISFGAFLAAIIEIYHFGSFCGPKMCVCVWGGGGSGPNYICF